MGSARGSVTAWFLACLPLSLQDAGAVPELAPLGVVEFEPEAWASRRAGELHVDARGQIWWSDEDTGRLHVYDARGTRLFVTGLEPAGEAAKQMPCWFADLPDGVLVGSRRYTGRFELDGTWRANQYRTTRRRAYLLDPLRYGQDARWEVGDDLVVLREVCAAARSIAVAHAGTFGPAALDREGGLVVCEQAPATSPDAFPPRLRSFARSGQETASLTLDDVARVLDVLAEDGHTLLLLEVRAGQHLERLEAELRWLGPEGSVLRRARIPAAGNARRLVRSPAGDELWVFTAREPRLVRFARN